MATAELPTELGVGKGEGSDSVLSRPAAGV